MVSSIGGWRGTSTSYCLRHPTRRIPCCRRTPARAAFIVVASRRSRSHERFIDPRTSDGTATRLESAARRCSTPVGEPCFAFCGIARPRTSSSSCARQASCWPHQKLSRSPCLHGRRCAPAAGVAHAAWGSGIRHHRKGCYQSGIPRRGAGADACHSVHMEVEDAEAALKYSAGGNCRAKPPACMRQSNVDLRPVAPSMHRAFT